MFRAVLSLSLISRVVVSVTTVMDAADPRVVWSGRTSPVITTQNIHEETTSRNCTIWSGAKTGYISFHQIGSPLRGISLTECQQQCDKHAACASVDFSEETTSADKSWCNLRDCSDGDGECTLHQPSNGFSSYTCEARHRIPSIGMGRRFDWLGVSARVAVKGASFVTANITTTSKVRGTRLKVYTSDQGFGLYPEVQLWVSPLQTEHVIFLRNKPRADEQRVVTLENIVPPQYQTGITTIVSFTSDGVFVQAPSPRPHRRIEFVGDSITAATNVVRPEGAPGCGDGGYQSDWSQTYEGLLCHYFDADCSTIAVGGKCVMRECGGLQMPDYYLSQFYADAPALTHNFSSGWAPDAVFVDLGTNDMRVIQRMGDKGAQLFVAETVAFLTNITNRYRSRDIQFFLNAGPMENTTMPLTLSAIAQAKQKGLKATFVDMTTACVSARQHGNSDGCDGCAGHPGVEGHRGMFEAARPVMASVMGWNDVHPFVH